MSSPDYVAILQRARMRIEQWSIIQGIWLFTMAKVSHFGVPREATMLLLLLLLMHAFSILMVFFKKNQNREKHIKYFLIKKDEIFALAQRNFIGMQKQTNFTVYIVAVRNVWWIQWTQFKKKTVFLQSSKYHFDLLYYQTGVPLIIPILIHLNCQLFSYYNESSTFCSTWIYVQNLYAVHIIDILLE